MSCPPTPEETARRLRHGRLHLTFGTTCTRYCREREDNPICDMDVVDDPTAEVWTARQCMRPAVETCMGLGYCVHHWGSATVGDKT